MNHSTAKFQIHSPILGGATVHSSPPTPLSLGLVLCIAMFWTAGLLAGEKEVVKASPVVTIQKISSESSPKMSVVSLRLDHKPDWGKIPIEDHGGFLQFVLPNTMIPESGSFYDGNSPYIDKIAVFQTKPTETVVRLFTSQNATALKERAEAELLDTRLVFTLDHAGLQDAKKVAVAKVEAEKLVPAKKIEAAEKEKNAGNLLNQVIGIDDGLEGKVKMLAFFSCIFFLMVLCTLTMRRVFRNRKLSYEGESVAKMKLLTNLSLSPKQKLSLVQVGGEQLLLAITPDHVSLIAKIETVKPTPKVPLQNINRLPVPPKAVVKDRFTQFPPKEETIQSIYPPSEPVNLAQEKKAVEKKIPRETSAIQEKPQKKINYAISDDGIQNQSGGGPKEVSISTHKAIADVTKLIREKLKNLG